MSLVITAEHVELTNRDKEQMAQALEKLNRWLSDDSQVQLFVKRETDGQFRVILNVHYDSRDIAANEAGPHLMPLVRSAKATIMRRLGDRKQMKIHARRASHRFGAA